jgi:hypothetical protein
MSSGRTKKTESGLHFGGGRALMPGGVSIPALAFSESDADGEALPAGGCGEGWRSGAGLG